jgi:outer membrane protein
MKRRGWILGGILILILVFAASPVAAVEKIGFVNVQEVMVTSIMGKKETEDLKKGYDKAKAALEGRESELKKLKDEIDKQRPLLKEEAIKEKETVLQSKYREYQNLLKASEEEIQGKDREIQQRMIPEIMKIVQAIGEKEKYTMIVDYALIPLAYHAKEKDLTKRVLDEFNKTYKPGK